MSPPQRTLATYRIAAGQTAGWIGRLAALLLLTAGSAAGETSSPTLTVEEVRFPSLDHGVELAGTLTSPAGEGPFPAAILLGVAGPDDRDQSVGRHRGFAVLARHLGEHGIASLRWDDRGVGASSGDYLAASYDDLVADALGAVRLLASRAGIDGSAIGAIGNSEGGAIGPLAATRSDDLAFVVLLAGPGTAGVETIRGQLESAIARMQIGDERAGRLRQLFDRFVEIEGRDPEAPGTREEMLRFLDAGGKSLFPPYAFVPSDRGELADFLLGRWYRSQLAYEPATVLPRLRVPVLALVGDKDTVLPADPHLERIRRFCAGNPDFTAEVLPGLNHLFQTAVSGSPLEYAMLGEAFAPQAARRVAHWILERFGPGGPAGARDSAAPQRRNPR